METIQQFLQRELSEGSIRIYLYEIEKFRKHHQTPEGLKYCDIMDYVELLRKRYSPQSVHRAVCAIKKYYDYLLGTGKSRYNPAKNIRIKDGRENPIQLQELLTGQELQKLFEPREERYPMLERRNRIVISLLVHQALLVGDIEKLRIGDIDLKAAKIRIGKTAVTNERILDLKAEQILLFYEYLQGDREIVAGNRQPSTDHFLLGKLGNKIRKADVNYLLSTYQDEFTKRLTPMKIRQSVIKVKLDQGENLRKVQYFAGHKNADTTEKYKESGIDALQTAINQYHPIK